MAKRGVSSYTLKIRQGPRTSSVSNPDAADDLVFALDILTLWWSKSEILPSPDANQRILDYITAMNAFRAATNKYREETIAEYLALNERGET